MGWGGVAYCGGTDSATADSATAANQMSTCASACDPGESGLRGRRTVLPGVCSAASEGSTSDPASLYLRLAPQEGLRALLRRTFGPEEVANLLADMR